MKHRWLAALTASILVGSSAFISAADPPDPGVTLVGTGAVPGTNLDLSGLQGTSICALDIDKNVTTNCIDRATLGGFGSGLTYTGLGHVFLAVPDRGPFDGRTDVPYFDRFHLMRIAVDTSVQFPPTSNLTLPNIQTNIQTQLLDTRFFRNEKLKRFVGDAYAFDTTDPLKTLRFDPEGVRIGRDGSIFVSDEYGPYIFRFNALGFLIERLPVPSKFLLDLFHPGATGHQSGDINNPTDAASLELTPQNNSTGRQANRGMEGLAITPDGKKLVGIMQNALIQDNGLNIVGDPNTVPGRRGLNNRILTIDLKTGETHEYVYTLDAKNDGKGVNEMLAINDHEFLVLERDNKTKLAGSTPGLKRIYKIDLSKNGLNNVTDVTQVVNLPELGGAALDNLGIVPVKKTLFIDMLKDVYKVGPTQTIKDVIAEKIEGMAWGPDLPDGKHVLYVTSDNDLNTAIPTQIYAFAVDSSAANIDYQPQKFLLPLLFLPLPWALWL